MSDGDEPGQELPAAVPLSCHPDTPSHRVAGVAIHVAFQPGHRLWVRYVIYAPLDTLELPGPAPHRRADQLWHHSCCELFLRRPGESRYAEFNLSPSGEWAAYAFSGYRDDGRDLDLRVAPRIDLDAGASYFALEAEVDLPVDWQATSLAVALSAVIEEKGGTKSYWALRHLPGKPDFHHPDCFALTLGAPPAA